MIDQTVCSNHSLLDHEHYDGEQDSWLPLVAQYGHSQKDAKYVHTTNNQNAISLPSLVLLDPYGSSESTRIDGTATSAFVSWDSKVTTVNGILGGVLSLVRARMQREGLYDEFIRVASNEYKRVFDKPLEGTSQEFCLPKVKVQDVGLVDFAGCSL